MPGTGRSRSAASPRASRVASIAEAPSVFHHPVGHALESVRAFAIALARDEPPPVSAEDGVAAARIVAAIHQSARSKQPVLVEQTEPGAARDWDVAGVGLGA